jgi:peroxiredoxin
MVLTKTPICNFGEKTKSFELKGVDGKRHKLDDHTGKNGLLIMFICNHCPYVKSILEQLVVEVSVLQKKGVACIAINSNDSSQYPEDSFENMQKISKKFGFSFPYLFDDTQAVAQSYKAVCTPDFFGYNAELELLYRGRFDDRKTSKQMSANSSDLFKGMIEIARTGNPPLNQIPSVGCSIKWRGSE